MTRRRFLTACCLVLSAASTFAQPRGGKPRADPLSGTWAGELVAEGGPGRVPVTLELKFDGKSAVTGTIAGLPNPGDVKTGAFDPKTGALKLQLGKVGNSDVLLVLEGTVAKGTASGRISGELGGDFKFAKKK